jgi:ABC-type Mn2+/Zn2+ transport system ATPase subunit
VSALVQCRGLAVGHDGHVVVPGIDVALAPGQWLAVIGTNGSGKSTLLKTLAGLISPLAGSVTVAGAAPIERRAVVSYLSQSHEQGFLLPIRSRDVVRMGRWPARGLTGRLRAGDEQMVEQAMESLGITALADQPLGTLSGGQCQRVHLAQAVCRGADLLLLDEPTSGLDAASQERYLALMDDERARGACIVSATHDVREARRADLVLVVAGRVVACGAPAQVLTAEVLAEAFGVVLGDAHAPVVLDPHHGHGHHHGPGAPHVHGHAPGHDHHGHDH